MWCRGTLWFQGTCTMVIDVFLQMGRMGTVLGRTTFALVLKSCSSLEDHGGRIQINGLVVKMGFDCDVVTIGDGFPPRPLFLPKMEIEPTGKRLFPFSCKKMPGPTVRTHPPKFKLVFFLNWLKVIPFWESLLTDPPFSFFFSSLFLYEAEGESWLG